MNNKINLRSGTILNGKYKIVEQLGEGIFGETYLIQHIQNSSSIFALKKFKSKIKDTEILGEAKKRFFKEIKTLEILANNPLIPEIIDSFEINGEFYLVREWIEGRDIQKEIEEKNFLSELEIIRLLQSTLETLYFIHQQGVLHRNIKPSNLIRRLKDNKIFLTDFGELTQITTLYFNSKTQNYLTKIIGTPEYMPIEQIRGTPTFSSDIYSLGITAIYALTGQKPEIQPNNSEIFDERNWKENINISPELVSILDKMICPDLNRNHLGFSRYQSTLEVLQDLEPLLKIELTLGGRYKIHQYLGGSIWGDTFLAEDLFARQSLGSNCIVKSLRPENNKLSDDAEERFNKELAALRELGSHDLIPGFLNEFAENGEIYFVREFIEGNDLNQEIKNNKHLNENNVIRILFDVLETLQFVHSNRIIHRDIKPSNLIRRSSDGKIALIDFGAVKEIVQLSSNNSKTTQSTQALGTEGYMSPEQRAKRPTFASDLYSLGMTAIHLLTGKHPEELETDPQTGNLIWRNEAEVSQDLASILDKMVQVGLGKGGRYQSAGEVLSILNRKFRKVRLNKTPQNIPNSNSSNFPKFNWKIAIGLAFVVSILAVFLFGLNSLRKDRALFLQGVELFQQQKYQEAIRKFDEVLAINANHHQALINLAIAQGRLKQYSDMLASCKLAITIQNNDSYAWNCQGEALHNLQRYDEALISFNKAIVFNPNDPYYWFNKTESLLALKKSKESLAVIERAIEIIEENKNEQFDPAFLSAVYSSKGRALREEKQYDQAIELYLKALEFNPQYFPALRDIGITLKNLKKYDEAIRQFNKITSSRQFQFTDEQKSQIYYFNGLVWCEQKDYEMAADNFDKALEINPDYESAAKAKAFCQS